MYRIALTEATKHAYKTLAEKKTAGKRFNGRPNLQGSIVEKSDIKCQLDFNGSYQCQFFQYTNHKNRMALDLRQIDRDTVHPISAYAALKWIPVHKSDTECRPIIQSYQQSLRTVSLHSHIRPLKCHISSLFIKTWTIIYF